MGCGFSLCFGLGLGPGLNLTHNSSHTRWEPPSGRYSGFLGSLGYYVTHSGALFGALFDSFGSPTDPDGKPRHLPHGRGVWGKCPGRFRAYFLSIFGHDFNVSGAQILDFHAKLLKYSSK